MDITIFNSFKKAYGLSGGDLIILHQLGGELENELGRDLDINDVDILGGRLAEYGFPIIKKDLTEALLGYAESREVIGNYRIEDGQQKRGRELIKQGIDLKRVIILGRRNYGKEGE